jgi:hypothetical protein
MVKRKTHKTVIHYVVPLGNGWAVKSTASSGFMIITDRKQEAVDVARTLAKKGHAKLIVQNKAGKVLSSKDYALAG